MITQERAKEIWAQRGIQNSLPDSVFKDGEREIIIKRWEQLPGHTSFMDAFFTFLHPQPLEVCYKEHELRATILNRYVRN